MTEPRTEAGRELVRAWDLHRSLVHGDERPSNIGELVEKAEAEAAEQARADLVADRDALRAALSRIAGWSAHYKDEAKTSIRLSLRLIHDEAMRAHPNALTGSVSEPRPDTLDDIDEAWHRDRPSQPLCNHALARRGSVWDRVGSEPPRARRADKETTNG